MGYRTCYYRTFVVGSASRAQVYAYDKCRDILDEAISLIKPGATTAEVVSVWPKAEEFGFPNEEAAFALQYGHGIGLAIWEKPIFSRMVSYDHPEVIKEGMVFALETFWPASDGWSAARIEEEMVVTADGCEVISRFPAEELLVTGPKYYAATGPLSNVRDTESNWNNPRVHPNGRQMPVSDHAPVAGGSD
jgi:Xaa-Pro aminopeptidase